MVRLVDKAFAQLVASIDINGTPAMLAKWTPDSSEGQALRRGIAFATALVERRTIYTLDTATSQFVHELAQTPIRSWWTHNAGELNAEDSIMFEMDYVPRSLRMVACIAGGCMTLYCADGRYLSQYPFGAAWDPETLALVEENGSARWVRAMQAACSGFFFIKEPKMQKAIMDESWDDMLDSCDMAANVFPIGASDNPNELSYSSLRKEYEDSILTALDGEVNPLRVALAAYAVSRFDRENIESKPKQIPRSLVHANHAVPSRTLHEVIMDVIPASRKLLVHAQKSASEHRERAFARKKRHKVTAHDRHYKSGLVIRIEEHERGDHELGWTTPRYRLRMRPD